MARLQDLWKKGTGEPLASEMVEGGLAIDIAGKRIWSKSNDGGIFEIGCGTVKTVNTVIPDSNGNVHLDPEDIGAAEADHSHPIGDVIGLQDELDGRVISVVAGENITVDDTDPQRPIVSASDSYDDSWIQPALNEKEDDLDLPEAGLNVPVLTSDTDGNRSWVEKTIEPTVFTVNDIEPIAGNITLAADDVHSFDKDNDYIFESSSTVSTDDAFVPIILDENGKVSPSFLDFNTFRPVGTWNPTDVDNPVWDPINDPLGEYPNPVSSEFGDFWIAQDIDEGLDPENPVPYTFVNGDLAGETVFNGDFIIWGITGWMKMVSEMDPRQYYRLDGESSITHPFAGGNQVYKLMADPVDVQDGVNLRTIEGKLQIGTYN